MLTGTSSYVRLINQRTCQQDVLQLQVSVNDDRVGGVQVRQPFCNLQRPLRRLPRAVCVSRAPHLRRAKLICGSVEHPGAHIRANPKRRWSEAAKLDFRALGRETVVAVLEQGCEMGLKGQ